MTLIPCSAESVFPSVLSCWLVMRMRVSQLGREYPYDFPILLCVAVVKM